MRTVLWLSSARRSQSRVLNARKRRRSVTAKRWLRRCLMFFYTPSIAYVYLWYVSYSRSSWAPVVYLFLKPLCQLEIEPLPWRKIRSIHTIWMDADDKRSATYITSTIILHLSALNFNLIYIFLNLGIHIQGERLRVLRYVNKELIRSRIHFYIYPRRETFKSRREEWTPRVTQKFSDAYHTYIY
jgi:hypothetical protein